jgi:hypothetical protein
MTGMNSFDIVPANLVKYIMHFIIIVYWNIVSMQGAMHPGRNLIKSAILACLMS